MELIFDLLIRVGPGAEEEPGLRTSREIPADRGSSKYKGPKMM